VGVALGFESQPAEARIPTQAKSPTIDLRAMLEPAAITDEKVGFWGSLARFLERFMGRSRLGRSRLGGGFGLLGASSLRRVSIIIGYAICLAGKLLESCSGISRIDVGEA
jgi:hypothetical protein